MKKISISALSLIAALAASSAFAAEQPTPPAGGPQGQSPAHHMFDDTDTNKDGLISKEEWVAKGDKMFSEIDANKDGKISEDEMKAHHDMKRAEYGKRHAEMEQHRTEAGGKPEGKPEAAAHGKPDANPIDAPKPTEKK
jgi:hypothetical protein